VFSKHLRRKAWVKFARAHIHRRQSWRMKAILMSNANGCKRTLWKKNLYGIYYIKSCCDKEIGCIVIPEHWLLLTK